MINDLVRVPCYCWSPNHSLLSLLGKERNKPARTYPCLNDEVGQGSVRAGKAQPSR